MAVCVGWMLLMGVILWPLAASASESYGPVRSGESLWEIAGRLQTGTGLSRDQIMLALLEANPDAVAPSCNLNGALRIGALLQVPDPAVIGRLDAESARKRVAEQNRAWRLRRAQGRELVCPTRAPEAAGGGETPAAEPPAMPAPPSAEPGAEPKPSPQPAAAPEPQPPSESAAPPEPTPPPAAGPAVSGSTTPAAPECPCPDSVQPPRPDPLGESLLQEALGGSPERPSHLAPGPRAPGWLLVPLLLALMTAAMMRWERRHELVAVWRSPTAALEAAATLPKRALLILSPGRRELHLLLMLSALAGFLGALVTVLFREGIHGMEWLLSGHSGSLVAMSMSLPPWERFLFPIVGGVAAGLVLQEVGRRLKGPRTTDYMEAIAVGDGWISVRHSLVKAVSSLFTVASGGSIGREGAMVQLSAMVASTLGRLARFPRDPMRLLVAAGAAAGLASAYNAPIAATIFIAEIVLGSIAIDHIGPLIIAAVIANITVHDVFGYAPVYDIPDFHIVSDWELGLYLVLGLLAGHMAPIFLNLLERSHHLFARMPVPLAVRLGIGGLIVGAISVYEPQVWGNGYSVVNAVLLSPWMWQALLTVLVLKMLSTAATHGSGAVGGAFTPTLFVGALLGALFGTLVQVVIPEGTAPPNAYAVVGMGAMLAGTTHAPLMSILMVFEMTMDYQIVLPLMLAVIVAHYTSRRYTEIKPMYAESLLPRES